MILAKVKGNIISTPKHKELFSHKLMIVHPINTDREYTGSHDMIAIDTVDSGIGDIVLVVKEGDAVQQILGHGKAPINTMIVAVVDNIDLSE